MNKEDINGVYIGETENEPVLMKGSDYMADSNKVCPELNKAISKMRSIPLKPIMCIQEYVPEEITINTSDSSRINPLEIKGIDFKNPFSKEETIQKIKTGGFDDIYDFIDTVEQLKSYDKEEYKNWWINDGTKSGALRILPIRHSKSNNTNKE